MSDQLVVEMTKYLAGRQSLEQAGVRVYQALDESPADVLPRSG